MLVAALTSPSQASHAHSLSGALCGRAPLALSVGHALSAHTRASAQEDEDEDEDGVTSRGLSAQVSAHSLAALCTGGGGGGGGRGGGTTGLGRPST